MVVSLHSVSVTVVFFPPVQHQHHQHTRTWNSCWWGSSLSLFRCLTTSQHPRTRCRQRRRPSRRLPLPGHRELQRRLHRVRRGAASSPRNLQSSLLGMAASRWWQSARGRRPCHGTLKRQEKLLQQADCLLCRPLVAQGGLARSQRRRRPLRRQQKQQMPRQPGADVSCGPTDLLRRSTKATSAAAQTRRRAPLGCLRLRTCRHQRRRHCHHTWLEPLLLAPLALHRTKTTAATHFGCPAAVGPSPCWPGPVCPHWLSWTVAVL